VARVDGPEDVKALALDDTAPLDSFLDALDAIAEEIADNADEGRRRIGRSFAERWASMYRTLVDHLEDRPRRMLTVASDEVVPWFFPEAELAVDEAGSGRAELRSAEQLPAGFQAGLVEGFLAQIGVPARVRVDGSTATVDWGDHEPDRPHPARVLAEATRFRYLTATIVPVVVGSALAFVDGSFSWTRGAGALVAAAVLHVSANLLNDVLDHRRGVDEANLTPTPFSGGSRVIQRGLLDSERVLGLASLMALVGFGLGLWLAATAGWPVLALGAIGVGLGYAYSADPIRLSHRGLGEVAVGVAFGPLMTGGAWAVQTGTLSAEALLVGVPLGAMMAGLLAVNELPDARWDERTGKHTLVVRTGDRAPWAIAGLFAFAYLSIAGLAVAGVLAWPVVVALATLPLAVHVVRGVRGTNWETGGLVAYQAAAFGLHASTGLLVAIGVALGGWG
jgi:1,4-dihydroxy-2-naphthoate octaprenyltransferase